jgi:methylated-DNA-[protein]-cysteine S-methyltransferase
MTTPSKAIYASPIGAVEIAGTSEGITAVDFVAPDTPGSRETPACLEACYRQIHEYFTGRRQVFTVDLIFAGTDFQKKVWHALLSIPYGQVASYGQIAAAVGNPKACRAVGSANGKNPIGIIVPCHRVIGSNGTLTGYGGGLWRKEWLLAHEKGLSARMP